MKKQLIYSCLVTFLSINGGLFTAKASAQELQGFSGHWVRNDAASDFGSRDKQSEPSEIDITVEVRMKEDNNPANGNSNSSSHTEKKIKVERNFAEEQGKFDGYTEELGIDGIPMTVSSDAATKKTVHIIIKDPKSFTEIADYVSTENDTTKKWSGKLVWSLSEDGQVLTVTSSFDAYGDKNGSTIVFKKR